MTSEPLEPDYAVAPGETLAEWLEERRMKQAELASRINISEKALSQIVTGAAPLTRATAAKLELVTGVPARTWNNLEALYQDDRARVARRADLESHTDWLSEMPVSALRKLGMLTAPSRDKAGLVRQLLEFFGVSDPDAWRRLWLGQQAAALRQSPAFASHPGAVAAWLRLGELEADNLEVAEFNALRLRASLPALRALTREPDPAVFVDEMVRVAAECGVAVVFVPEVRGARCSGAARWVRGRPVVQLSLRFGTDDQLWFTFFHELAHVVLHGKKDVFISDGSTDRHAYGHKEREADDLARNLLIPHEYAPELAGLTSIAAMKAFAERIGVSPGIVVGRLQHDKIVGFHVGQSLKVRYTLAASTEECPDRASE
ncbi:ImmA/IrrE family metallo-endopeptidase [Mycobacterium barrassiae]|uniref:ImmA/IrrE family metallo-endopeptidase n=1 Tax=Mycobacterium barrassiae TaxID=319709 RepID=UPI002265A876|nr:ImmA/IrrE family metallo-endopeptidase [Mycobacterium barrassiae]MCV7301221.1 ImmA/IrrE family metallo-endopeptidase [Mycobacterium barrassiae]